MLWHDSATRGGWQYDPTKMGGIGKLVSLGFLLDSNPTYLTITTSISGEGAAIDPISIPWGAVVHCESLPEEFSMNALKKPKKKKT